MFSLCKSYDDRFNVLFARTLDYTDVVATIFKKMCAFLATNTLNFAPKQNISNALSALADTKMILFITKPTALYTNLFSCLPQVGIVGRTEAGKSSLTYSVFRLLEPSSGSITTDSEDVRKFGLHDLRSRLTILP